MWKQKIDEFFIRLKGNMRDFMIKLKDPSTTKGIGERVNAIPMKWLYGAVAILLSITIVISIFLGIQLTNAKKGTLSLPHKPDYKTNAVNFIYVSETRYLGDKLLSLKKMLVDSVATVFYFGEQLPLMDYEVTLLDDQGKIYNIDLTTLQMDAGQGVESKKDMILRFDPLDAAIKRFILTFEHSYSGEKAIFDIVVGNLPLDAPVKNLSKKIVGDVGDPDVNITVENVVFAPTGTQINYQLHWLSKHSIIHGWKGILMSELIKLEEDNRLVTPLKPYPELFSFSKYTRILGYIGFEGVRNLNGNINLYLNHLYRSIGIQEEVDAYSLLNASAEDAISVPIMPYTLVLERMRMFEDQYVMVYHVLKGQERVEARIDGELVISNDSGMEVILSGTCRAKLEGGDITFSTKDASGILESFSPSTITLRIAAVGIRIPDVKIPIALSNIKEEDKNTMVEDGKDFIKESFQKRLAVKSGLLSKDELKLYFTSSVLQDEKVQKDYFEPIILQSPAQYNSKIITIGSGDDQIITAVVQDVWKGMSDHGEERFYRTHKVVAQKRNEQWMIVEDIIIR